MEELVNQKEQPVTTIKIKAKKPIKLTDYLKSHKYDKSKHPIITNTRIPDQENGIPGGSYYISEEEYPEFLELVFNSIIKTGKREYLTEKQLEKNGPILIDIDMRFSTDIKTRQYTKEDIQSLVYLYLAVLKEIYQFDEDTKFEIFILEKPRVNCLEEKTKDGLHIIIGIQADRTTQILLRKKILARSGEIWENLPITNPWDEILDDGISIGHTNWQMYGSSKPNHDTYALTQVLEIKFDTADQEFIIDSIEPKNYDINKNFQKLSARYSDHYSPFMKGPFLEEHALASGNKKKKSSSTSLTNTVLTNWTGLQSAAIYTQISNREQLELAIAEFLENADRTMNPDAREIFEYTMTLPQHYHEQGSYQRWIRICWVLKRECVNIPLNYFIIWVYFSAQAQNFDYSTEIPKMYDTWERTSIHEDNGVTKRSLIYWSKIDAFEKYKLVRQNTLDYYIEKTIDSPLQAFSSDDKKPTGCGEADLVEVLFHMKKDEFVCVSVRDNIWFQYKNHRWVLIDSGTTLRSIISDELRNEYYKKATDLYMKMSELPEGDNRLETMQKRLDRILSIMNRLGKTCDKKNIMTEAKDKFYDGEFMKKLDMNPYLMCFRNGVFDYHPDSWGFRDGKPDDYITLCTDIDYIPLDKNKDQSEIEEVKLFMRQLFPIPELERYMWEHLASVLVGVSFNQTFNNYIGGGSNGKSVLTNIMGIILGAYKYDLTHTAITCKDRTKVGGVSPEIASLRGKRYVVMAEPSKNDTINEGIMKQFTAGNDKITARGLYMVEPLEFLPQFTLVVCANQLLKINTTDHGTWRRIRLVDFLSRFTNNPVDNDPQLPYQYKLIPDIENKFKDGKLKNVFMAMLIEILEKTGGLVKDCDIVTAASDRYRQSQDVIAEFINDMYESCPGARILNKTCVSEDFKRWFNDTYGSKGPQPKEVYEYMDKKFGKPVNGKWLNVKKREINDDDDISMNFVQEVDI
jgi:P4 family phage/plasmid primase-like protien